MITKIKTLESLYQLSLEVFINNNDTVTKVSDTSALASILRGDAKINQLGLKDIAVLESQILPELAVSDNLDLIAERYGIDARFNASESSTYIRLVAEQGTVYTAGTNVFSGDDGVNFDLEEDVTIGSFGYTYAKVRSQTQGLNTNIAPGKINKVTPEPTGHSYVTNEYQSQGGRDNEQDDVFRKRILEGVNALATNTLSMIEQKLIKINNNVLQARNYGINDNGKSVLALVSQNGIDFTQTELNEMELGLAEDLSLVDIAPDGETNRGIELINITWFPIDISFRVVLEPSVNVDDVRVNIQIAFQKQLDYRFWENGQKVEWDNLLRAVKNTDGVKYVFDEFFFPRQDVVIPRNQLPRVRGFLMLDESGQVIESFSGNLNPTFYPNVSDFKFQQTVLRSI